MSAIFYVRQTLPWDHLPGESERLRKLMGIMLFLAFLIWLIVPLVKIPKLERAQEEAVPERLAKMVIAQKIELAKPKPIVRPKKEVKAEKPHETTVAKTATTRPREVVQDSAKATSDEVRQARGVAESKGVLAFKDSFSDMIDADDAAPVRLGADARVSTAGQQAVGGAGGRGAGGTRALITSKGGSGGIAGADISRGYLGSGSGGGGGSGGSGSAITGGGVKVGKAQSAVGASVKEAGRPLSKGVGPARTDEEIQIVFDKYKAALYRIYNRELRNDPSLRGKMVLALTIEPDGQVSACKVQSTDMDSPTLSADIVEKVLKFNFGAKEGVPTTKIVYPIDFLPAG